MALVTTCKKKGSDGRGYRYMVVTLGAPYYDENGDKSNYSFKDHIALYDWAFSEFVYTNIVKMNEQVTQVDVKHGKDVDKVGICASEDYYTLLEKSLNKTTVSQNVKLYSERVPIQAPQNKGYEVGELELKLNDETLATVKLITESDLELDTNAFYMEKIGQVVANPLFKWLCVLVGVELVLLIVTHYMKQSFRRKVEAMNRRRRISIRSGSVTLKNTCRDVAPSMFAASKRLWSMPMIPAMSKIVVLPNHMRKFMRLIKLRTVKRMLKKSIGASIHPACVSS